MELPREAILHATESIVGDDILDPERLIERGFPAAFIEPLIQIVETDYEDPHQWLFDAQGKQLNQIRGVFGLNLLYAIARELDAVPDDPPPWGRKKEARMVAESIRAKLDP